MPKPPEGMDPILRGLVSVEDVQRALAAHAHVFMPTGIVLVNEKGEAKRGLEAKFQEGEMVVVRDITFRIQFLNEGCMVLAPVSQFIPFRREGDDEAT